uniref:Alpha-mannosidase n=1 Tax=Bursaphelenchus xylophilus TaxID=6326 RepID=A0A1I7SE47_BURXY
MHKWLATGFSVASLFLFVFVLIAQNEDDPVTLATVSSREGLFDDRNRLVDLKVDGNTVTFQTPYNRSHSSPNDTLNVFLVFHSHTDPGWLRTFNEYYDEKVERILDLAVDFLTQHQDAKFIWSEISFLSEWWDRANETSKEAMVELVQNGQLELTGGTWVMNDEAITHFAASIDNIIEGHTFVNQNFKVLPTTSWSVDPFGHGSTMPYLLGRAGVDNLVVGRLSKHVKEQMIRRGALKFLWKEPWSESQLHLLDFLLVRSQMFKSIDQLQPHRRTVSLVQHHDAITATSRPHVMTDYEDRLFNASIHIQKLEAAVWASRMSNVKNVEILFYQRGRAVIFDEKMRGTWLTIYNPRTFDVNEKITLRVNSPNVVVRSFHGSPIEAQLLPLLIIDEWKADSAYLEVVFYVELKALESKKIWMEMGENRPESTVMSSIYTDEKIDSIFETKPLPNGTFEFENNELVVVMEDGYVQKMLNKHTGKEEPLEISYSFYSDMGGAYVFAPMSKEKPIVLNRTLANPIYISGPLITRAYSHIRSELLPKLHSHQVFEFEKKSRNLDFALELFSNVEEIGDSTIVMNVKTEIWNGDSVYTDVNGLFLRERRRFEFAQTPSANYFPAATAAMIQDKTSRLSVLYGQPTGVYTPKRGQIQFFVDRTLSGDDGKGLSYGDASYSEPAKLKYRFQWEERYITHANPTTLYHSRRTHQAMTSLLSSVSIHNSQKSERKFDTQEWPCDLEMINVRYLNSTRFAITFRKLEFDSSVVHAGKCETNVRRDLRSDIALTIFPTD